MRGILLLSLAVFVGCGDTHNCPPDGGRTSMPDLSTDITDVLETENELNIGNGSDVPSRNAVIVGTAPNISVTSNGQSGPGVEVLVLMANGSSQLGKIITISVGARQVASLPLNRSTPVVGVLEFGSGGNLHVVEFDIPTGGIIRGANNVNDPVQGGTIISFPSSSFKLSARNDSVAFSVDANEFAVGDLTWGAIEGQSNDVASVMRVEAFATYNARTSIGPVRLTVPFVRQAGAGIPLSFTYRIPSFAKRLILRRNPLGVAVQVSFLASSQNLVYDIVTIPAGVNSPILDIPQQADVVFVDTLGVNIKDVFGDFEIQL